MALSLVFGASQELLAQETTSLAQTIYKQAAESVVLVETRDSRNEPNGQATAFVIGPGLLVTNAHAVVAPSLWIRVGTVTIPARVERIDHLNDLALMTLASELPVPALSLSDRGAPPGARVFAIGNPIGLERTISEGLSAGVRVIDGRSRLQMSAPISQGSSGGPILDERGKVVGVAVSISRDAQNVNFAVPAEVVAHFLAEKPTSVGTDESANRAMQLLQDREKESWSVDPDSRYQRLSSEISNLLEPAVAGIRSEAVLAAFAKRLNGAGENEVRLTVLVARQRAAVSPQNGAELYAAAESIRVAALYLPSAEQSALYEEAERYGARAVALSELPDRRERLLSLGRIQRFTRTQTAVANLLQVVSPAKDGLSYEAALNLFAAYQSLGQAAEAVKWFAFAEGIRPPEPRDYARLGKLLEEQGQIESAAAAFAKSGEAAYAYARRCDAARLFSKVDRNDEAMVQARSCLEHATTAKDGDANAEWAHRLIASILIERGVTDQAIGHAREAIAINPKSGPAFAILAQGLIKARRFSEGEEAARTAIRLTDGAYEYMHFDLGLALFRQQRWIEAKESFAQAARMDPSDDAASYNVALAFQKAEFYQDAAKWYEETLRRNPTRSDAAELRRRIQRLRESWAPW